MRSLDFAVLQIGEAGVASLVDALTPLVGVPCFFRKQPRPMTVGSFALVDLLLTTNAGNEVTRANVAPSGDLPVGGTKETVQGIGERVIQVTAISIHQTLDKSARAYLEPLELKLRFASARDALRKLGLAFIGAAGPIQILDPENFGRYESAASIDLRCSYGIAVTDAPAPIIAQTTVRPTVDGDVLPPITES